MPGPTPVRTSIRTRIELALRPRPRRGDSTPRFDYLKSQPCTHAQMISTDYQLWVERVGEVAQLQRRQWEWFFVLQALRQTGAIRAGARCIEIGSDSDPIAPYLAAKGCAVTTVADLQRIVASGNEQPADAVWSVSVLDHLSVEQGRALIHSSLGALRDGGVAVHTLSYAVTAAPVQALRKRSVTAYRRRDLIDLERDLLEVGFHIECTFGLGNLPADRWIDRPPYSPTHLVAQTGAGTVTSFGLLIQKVGPTE